MPTSSTPSAPRSAAPAARWPRSGPTISPRRRIRGLLERAALPADRIDDVILGCANQAGEDNRNVARMAALLAGLPVEIPGQTVNRLCGSGLQAAASAAHAIRAGEGDVFVAGGVESMTRAPYVVLKPGKPGTARPAWPTRPSAGASPTPGCPPAGPSPLGQTAERVAECYGITRREQDEFAAESQRRAQDGAGGGSLRR